jgi:CIC family chloride channel protein
VKNRDMNAPISSGLHRIRPHLGHADNTVMILIAVVVGLLGGLCAVGFRLFIRLVQVEVWSLPEFTLAGVRALPWWVLLAVPAAGGLVVGLIVHFFAREAKGHGVPEVMEAVMLRGGRIRPRVVAAKLVASGICIGTGGSVGREGPIVQIGSSLGSTIGQWLHMGEHRLRTLVGCGAAAGIAATFNAPIAGALFAVEIILGDFALSKFTPIVISSVAATVVSHHFFGDVAAFAIPAYALVNPRELLAYGVLGIVTGLMALLFIRALYGMEDLFDDRLVRIPAPLRTLGGGLLIGMIALRFPEILGVGYEAIELALREQIIWPIMLALALVKILAVSLTIGSGGSGGIFAPSLFIGAMVGGALGGVVHTLWPATTASAGAYALVGMGAVVAAATHAPITAIMIIFELTGDYAIILPLMIACVISTLLATRLSPTSIYTRKLLRKGIDIFRGQSLNVLQYLKARDVMRTTVSTVEPGAHLLQLVSMFMDKPIGTIFVTDDDHRLLGLITMNDLRPMIPSASELDSVLIAHDIMSERKYPRVHPDSSLDEVMRHLGSYHDEVPVIEGGKLVGAIWPEDVINRYNSEIFKRETASSLAVSVAGGGRFAALPGVAGMSITEVEVPASFIGRSCADLDIRNRLGVTVLVVKRQIGTDQQIVNQVPDASYVFQENDILLVLGPMTQLNHLQNML